MTAERPHHSALGIGFLTRYDKTPESHLAGLHLRAATIWITSLLKAD